MNEIDEQLLNELAPQPYPTNRLTRLLWYSAGADARLLERCPYSDRVKFEGIGGIVLATSALASLSGGYAFYTVFSPKDATALSHSLDPLTVGLAVVMGAAWGLVVFNLDRFIVSSTGKGDGTDDVTLKEFTHALPRLLMALVIGVCISSPLEIRILKPEIDAQLELEQNDYRASLDAQSRESAETRKSELREKLDAAQAKRDERSGYFEKRRLEINEQRRLLELEAEGLTGSGSPGRGPAWQDKKDTLDKLEAELTKDREGDASAAAAAVSEITAWKAETDQIDTRYAEDQESHLRQARHLDGLLKRIQISHEIGGAVPWMIMALLVCVELCPILFKMMLIKGVYDYADENAKRLILARVGIEPGATEFLDGGKREVRTDTFHRAAATLEEEKMRLRTEARLSKKAHQRFSEETEAKIQDDVGSFLVGGGKSKG